MGAPLTGQPQAVADPLSTMHSCSGFLFLATVTLATARCVCVCVRARVFVCMRACVRLCVCRVRMLYVPLCATREFDG